MAKIFIVDDAPYSCSLFRALCKTKGHDTTVASTRGEGLKEVTTQSYDLAMLDFHLPD